MMSNYININIQLVCFKHISLWDVNIYYNVIKNRKIIMTKRQISQEEKAMRVGARCSETYYSVRVQAATRPMGTFYHPVKFENKFSNLLKTYKSF